MAESTPDEVLAKVKSEDLEFIDFRFSRPARRLSARDDPRQPARRGPVHRRPRLRRLVDPRVPGDPGIRHGADRRSRHLLRRPVLRSARPACSTASWPTRSPASSTAVTRATSPRRPRPTSSRPASPTRPTSAPSPSSSSSTTCASTPPATRPTTTSTRSRASGTPAPTRARTSATSRAPSRATSRCRRWTTTRTCAPRWRPRCTRSASRPSCTTTRWPAAARARSA